MARKLPSKAVLRKKADAVWSQAVKDDWGRRCAVCKTGRALNSHHLIPKGRCNTHRYEMRNGICLCETHHMFSVECSPHMGDIGFTAWLTATHPTIVEWVLENNGAKTTESVSQGWYLAHIARLSVYLVDEGDLLKICGPQLLDRIKAAEKVDRMTSINLNEEFFVTLTAKGAEILNAKWIADDRPEYATHYENEAVRMQLWELFERFGSHVYMGCTIPFVNNAITPVKGLQNDPPNSDSPSMARLAPSNR